VIGPPEQALLPKPWRSVSVRVTANDGRVGATHFFLRKSPEGSYRIDWEASVGYNPVPLKGFLVQRPQESRKFRVVCELDSYYNFDFTNTDNTHYSVKMRELETFGFPHGYVSKDSKDGKRLFFYLQDSKPHYMILELRHVGPWGGFIQEAGTNTVSITRVVSDSWIEWE
jgi:hypothetical protein